MAQDESTVDGAQPKLPPALESILDVGEKVLRERPTMEHVLLLLFFVTGVYMYWGAREFSDTAAEFPQLMAGATAILSFLILTRNYLKIVAPVLVAGLGIYALYTGGTAFVDDGSGLFRLVVGAPLLISAVAFRERVGESAESFVAEPMQILGDDDVDVPAQEEEKAEEEDEADSGAMYVYEIDDPKGPIVTGLLCIGYMLLTFTIGMLYATPIFVAAWALWARMDAIRAAALVLVSFVTAYLFYDIIQSDVSEGWWTGWEPTPPDDLIGLSVYAVDLLGLGVIV
ncbi:hypothetical protein [Natronobeatus ordinarius]|uniref:hypothetical protein n=1 Tax=Natronobeatus ordinarius TaxID=2963433 RepID=UPI0020CC9288|nr:hypothetical protein [Natronobeatus ordinarius]